MQIMSFISEFYGLFAALIGVPVAFLWRRLESLRRDHERGKDSMSEIRKDVALIEKATLVNADAIARVEKNHEASLVEFKGEVKGIHTELRGMRKEFVEGFKAVGDRMFEIMSQGKAGK